MESGTVHRCLLLAVMLQGMLGLSTCETRRVAFIPTVLQRTWSAWSNWTECSRSCGGGSQWRFRECLGDKRTTALNCVGNGTDVQPCNTQCCAVDCIWLNWSDWSACNKTCNGGWRYRTRSNSPGRCGGMECTGAEKEEEECNTQPCPNPCKDHGHPCYSSFEECTPLSDTQFRCGPCQTGLTGNGVTCSAVNECNLASPCFPGANCTDLWLGYECGVCPSGYNGSRVSGPDLAYALAHKQNCSDIDECAAPTKPCHPLRQCTNAVGSYSCSTCPLGYTNDGITQCLLMDPCVAKLHHCEKDAYCFNTGFGAFKCECPARMYGNGVYCIPYGDFDGVAGISFPDNFSSTNDIDDDGIPNDQDNCPYAPNANQLDSDLDLNGDVCDNCKLVRNANQADMDGDGIGDVCDLNQDGDNHFNLLDTCPRIPNPSQIDTDADRFGDDCDNCAFVATANQADSDYDGVGDACDSNLDRDGDGRQDNMDNCPQTPNAGQADADGDGVGDECDRDQDNDGLVNEVDSCPLIYNTTNDPRQCAGDFDGDHVTDDVDVCPDNAKISTTDLSHYVSVPLIPNPSIGIAANWNAKTAADVTLTSALEPYMLIGSTTFSSLEYSGTVYFRNNISSGYAGVVFNYQSNKQFMVAIWKKGNETIQFLDQEEHALAGMQVKLIDSKSGPSNPAMYGALWKTGDTDGQVKTLWRDPKFQSWEAQHPYKWKILYQTSCMRLTTYDGLNAKLLADSGCICGLTQFQGGRVGMFTFNQDNVIWTNIETKCYAEKQMKC